MHKTLRQGPPVSPIASYDLMHRLQFSGHSRGDDERIKVVDAHAPIDAVHRKGHDIAESRTEVIFARNADLVEQYHAGPFLKDLLP
jgi:hypothetical protein